MLRLLHDVWFGHVYSYDAEEASTPVFDCRCGKHWWVGFGVGAGPTRRDNFAAGPYGV